MHDSDFVVESNDKVKALVPYVPPRNNSRVGNVFDKVESFFYMLYLKRFKYYYMYFVVSVAVAILAGELFLRYPSFASANADKLASEYRVYGFSAAFLFKNFFGHALAVFLSFLSGFTVFSLPVSVLCFTRLSLSAFYLFGEVVSSEGFGFYSSFLLICIFAFFVFASVVFFTETATAYKRLYSDGASYAFFLSYSAFLFIYIITIVFILKIGLLILLPQ